MITESWLTPADTVVLVEATPLDFDHLHLLRPCGRGGGLAVFFKKYFKCWLISFGNFKSFEFLCFFISRPAPLLCIFVYRPPRYTNFITEFSELLSIALSNYDKVLDLGDFNIHVCYPTHPMAQEFLDLIEPFNLTQSVNAPTHTKGHILDLVLSSGFCPMNVVMTVVFISDHKAVTFKAPLPSYLLQKPIPITKSCIFFF